MTQVAVTLKIMPTSPEVDLSTIEAQAKEKIDAFGGKVMKTEQEPIAFGLKAVNLTFLMDEDKGSTEPVEQDVSLISGVNSAEVIDVRRVMG